MDGDAILWCLGTQLGESSDAGRRFHRAILDGTLTDLGLAGILPRTSLKLVIAASGTSMMFRAADSGGQEGNLAKIGSVAK